MTDRPTPSELALEMADSLNRQFKLHHNAAYWSLREAITEMAAALARPTPGQDLSPPSTASEVPSEEFLRKIGKPSSVACEQPPTDQGEWGACWQAAGRVANRCWKPEPEQQGRHLYPGTALMVEEFLPLVRGVVEKVLKRAEEAEALLAAQPQAPSPSVTADKLLESLRIAYASDTNPAAWAIWNEVDRYLGSRQPAPSPTPGEVEAAFARIDEDHVDEQLRCISCGCDDGHKPTCDMLKVKAALAVRGSGQLADCELLAQQSIGRCVCHDLRSVFDPPPAGEGV